MISKFNFTGGTLIGGRSNPDDYSELSKEAMKYVEKHFNGKINYS